MMVAAISIIVAKFNAKKEEIKKEDSKVYRWLIKKGLKHWCRALKLGEAIN